MATAVNVDELRSRVQDLYREVAESPTREFHFELGRPVAERVGYDPAILDRIAADAVASFAGVGCPFAVADLQPGERVLDLGSGSGMDSLYAALLTGPRGSVTGVDMTQAQLQKARQGAKDSGLDNVTFEEGYIEALPVAAESFDLVISNGVINLVADKPKVFAEIARVLKPGGRLAVADIVSEQQLAEQIVCDASLWAACIGGASQEDAYLDAIRDSGMKVTRLADNVRYEFISKSARKASLDYGVKSVTLLAEKRA